MKRKLSLCVIAGNVEQYIGRFLDQFGPLADEVVVVRAIGDAARDGVLRVAKEGGCKIGEYLNQRNTAWKHVDDFAAARQMSFDMATNEFVMWADTDDTITEESIAAIRDALDRMPEGFDSIEFPYEVPEDGLTVFRERIIRKGAAKWVSPVHEFLQFDHDPKIMRITNAKITHAPVGPRAPNNERNLRILESIPTDDRTLSHRFHLFQSLRAVGRIDDAIAEVTSILSDPPKDLGDPEKYELFVAAGQLSEEPEIRAQMMLQAIGVDPTRREAYGELALVMIGMGKPEKALGLTSVMRTIAKPSSSIWNERGKYYRYLGEQLHGMSLRACGRFTEADAIETNHFIRNGAKISVIHATRGRVKKAVEARRNWFNKASNPDAIEHIFAFDADDEQSRFLTVHNHVLLDGQGGSVAAWNEAAKKAKGAILVQMSDDWEPPMYWDELILDAIGDPQKPTVLAVGDGGRNDDLLCMAIMTRARYQQQGWMFHPDFYSVYSDNWFTDCAMRDGVIIDRRKQIVFEHIHPCFGKAEVDETYQRGNAEPAYRKGHIHYRRLLDGVLTSNDIEGWCNYGSFYTSLAGALPCGKTFVEVGSWLGQSIIHLAQRLQDIGKRVNLVCVDTFRGEEGQTAHVATVQANGGSVEDAFRHNIAEARVDDMIRTIVSDSAEAASQFEDGSLCGAFIDAAHSYAGCKRDLEAWFSKVAPGGIWSGHDYHWNEVKRAVDEHAAANGYEIVEMPGTVWMRKP